MYTCAGADYTVANMAAFIATFTYLPEDAYVDVQI